MRLGKRLIADLLGAEHEADTPLSRMVPITHCLDDRVIATRDNRLALVYKVSGAPYLTQTDAGLNVQHDAWIDVVNRLPHNVTIMVQCHRRAVTGNLASGFNNPFAKQFDRKFTESQASVRFVNDWYLMLIIEPSILDQKFSRSILSLFSTKSESDKIECQQSDTCRQLYSIATQVESGLSAYGLKPLSVTTQPNNLSVVMLAINAGEHIAYRMPEGPVYTGTSHKALFSSMAQLPAGNLASYLIDKRITFGHDTLQIDGTTRDSKTFAAQLSLKDYPSNTSQMLLDKIYHLPCTFLMTHTFSPLTIDKANKRCSAKLREINTIYKENTSSQIEIVEFMDAIMSGVIGLGVYHHSFTVFAKTLDSLESHIKGFTREAHRLGIGCVRESLAIKPAFFSQIVGNHGLAPRPAAICSKNFAGFANLHSEPEGHNGDNFLGSAIAALTTPALTPYWLNCHSQGSSDNPTSGHTLICGATNQGKSVLLGFLMCQLQRFNGKLWVFDRNRGLEIVTRALGGAYDVLTPGDAPKLNPFQLPDTKDNRDYLVRFLCHLVRREGELDVPAMVVNELNKCVEYNYQSAPNRRALRHAMQVLPIDFERMAEIKSWLNPNTKGVWFDHEVETLCLDKIHGFDLTYLSAPDQTSLLAVVGDYLMYRMQQALDGTVATLLCDEGWSWLLNPVLSVLLDEILVTWRKLKGHMVLATQSPSQILQSTVASRLLENTATKLFLPNSEAQASIYQDKLNLTEAEFNAIRTAKSSRREMLVKHDNESTMVTLDLTQMKDYLSIFSANVRSLELCRLAREQSGDNPANWIPIFLKAVHGESEK